MTKKYQINKNQQEKNQRIKKNMTTLKYPCINQHIKLENSSENGDKQINSHFNDETNRMITLEIVGL